MSLAPVEALAVVTAMDKAEGKAELNSREVMALAAVALKRSSAAGENNPKRARTAEEKRWESPKSEAKTSDIGNLAFLAPISA